LRFANWSKHNGDVSKNPLNDLGSSLGEYLREQRTSAKLSLRQLSELAGVSNPYLSQIERGLKRPSAEILQQLAKGLEVSAESLYVRAGILDAEKAPHDSSTPDVRRAVAEDPLLTTRQKKTLLDIYASYVEDAEP
jgi:transcriptional regulator with XRE-family HTH domain